MAEDAGFSIRKREFDSPETWIKALKSKGYTAANWPFREPVDESTIQAYKTAASKANIVIAEVGAWSNPSSPDESARKTAVDFCIDRLRVADQLEARCCVNVSGSRGSESIGAPHPDNLTAETFDMIVESTRKIIDEVQPHRTFYALEGMPWAYPDSVDSYLDLIKAIDRKAFAAHFDPVNWINSPKLYFNHGNMIKDTFRRLGEHIRSCHAKDTKLSTILTVHLDEVVPGTGNLDYGTYLRELSKLNDVPLMMEHMKFDEYPLAAEHIRRLGRENGIEM